MKYQICIPALILSVLFYEQDIGMNLPLAALTLVVTQFVFLPKLRKNKPWLLNTSFIVILCLTLFYSVDVFKFTILLFLLGINIYSVFSKKSTLGPGLLFSVATFISSPILNLATYERKQSKHTEENTPKPRSKLAVVSIVLLIFIVFLGLYSLVNQTLGDILGNFFDQFSFAFIGVLLLFSYALYAIIYPNKEFRTIFIEDDISNELTKEKGSVFESSIFRYTVICLVVLLSFVCCMDFYEIMNSSVQKQRYATYIHVAVGALFVSIVFIAVIVLILNRKRILEKSAGIFGLKNLALIWLALNLFLIATVAIKNYQYIAAGGLTYKRIGVYYWLIACALLIAILMFKIVKDKSSWFAFNRMNWAAAIVLAVAAIIPADKLILNNNLARSEQGLTYDENYLFHMVEGNELFFQENQGIVPGEYWQGRSKVSITKKLDYRRRYLTQVHNEYGWRSMDFQSYWFLETK